MINTIKIPLLPFASSIAGGEQHIGVRTTNDNLFNVNYIARLYNIHQDDIPQLITDRLSEKLDSFAKNMNKDLAMVMFDRLLTLGAKGILCTPTTKGNRIVTIVYHFNSQSDTLEVVVSIADYNVKEPFDMVYFAFSAEMLEEVNNIDINISTDVSVPLMLQGGYSLNELNDNARLVVKLICAFEANFAYHCIKFKNFMYDAMLKKDGIMLNPNPVQVNLLISEDEEKASI